MPIVIDRDMRAPTATSYSAKVWNLPIFLPFPRRQLTAEPISLWIPARPAQIPVCSLAAGSTQSAHCASSPPWTWPLPYASSAWVPCRRIVVHQSNVWMAVVFVMKESTLLWRLSPTSVSIPRACMTSRTSSLAPKQILTTYQRRFSSVRQFLSFVRSAPSPCLGQFYLANANVIGSTSP